MSIKVGPLDNGGECLESCDIGPLNVRLIHEPDSPDVMGGYVVAYLHKGTYLDRIEYTADEEQIAKDDWELIRQVLTNTYGCLK